MTLIETVRVVVEVLVALGAVAGVLWKVVKLGGSLHERLDHLDECLDDLKTKVMEAQGEHVGIVQSFDHMKAELFYLKGVVGVPLSQPVDKPPGQLK